MILLPLLVSMVRFSQLIEFRMLLCGSNSGAIPEERIQKQRHIHKLFSLSLALLDHHQQIGTMSARGILENPALYAGRTVTPWECIEDYVDLALSYGTNAFIFHHHLMYMFEKSMSNAGTILLFSSDQLMCTFRFLLRALPPLFFSDITNT